MLCWTLFYICIVHLDILCCDMPTAMLCLWLSHVRLFVTPWTAALQAPLSMGILQARILEWVAISSSRRSSQPRDWTQVSRTVGRFLTSWATRETHEYWSGQPIPSPTDLPDPGIEPGSPALQADSSPAELSGIAKILSTLYVFNKW